MVLMLMYNPGEEDFLAWRILLNCLEFAVVIDRMYGDLLSMKKERRLYGGDGKFYTSTETVVLRTVFGQLTHFLFELHFIVSLDEYQWIVDLNSVFTTLVSVCFILPVRAPKALSQHRLQLVGTRDLIAPVSVFLPEL